MKTGKYYRRRETAGKVMDIFWRCAIGFLVAELMWTFSNDIQNTWHDTRIICQQVTHTQSVKVCR